MKTLVLLLSIFPMIAHAGFAEDQASQLRTMRTQTLELIRKGEFKGDAQGCRDYVSIYNNVRVNGIHTAQAMGMDATPIAQVKPLPASVCIQ